jgi:peptide deformylase
MPLDLITIEQNPSPSVLTEPAQEVSFPLSEATHTLISEMKALLELKKGVGLAAPQVGHPQKILVYVISEDAKALRANAKETVPMTVLINPSYTALTEEQNQDWEGCFSVAKTYGKVPRYNKISYKAQDMDGNVITGQVEGFTARVLQHEIDHLHGTLILHRFHQDSLKGSPEEMMPLRFKEFTEEQQAIAQRLLNANKAK